jgi:hypothetical protein
MKVAPSPSAVIVNLFILTASGTVILPSATTIPSES